ncbi:MAG: protein-L-isoaspartate O-methyltransferase [Sphingobium sp.]|nr:protein-L-isoaspartate O-methyltransferase [Sphingobium sp.]
MSEVNFAEARRAMVTSQLRTSDVNDSAVVAAMLHLAREEFLPQNLRGGAYIDRPLPLGNGRAINPPLATGRILEEAQIVAGEKVLLAGDATGYTAALLDILGANVTVVDGNARPDTVPASVNWVQGKAGEGHAAGAPYDVIVIDGAVDALPDALLAQLAEGGRVVTGLNDRGVVRLVTGRKVADSIGFLRVIDMDMVPAAGFEAKAAEFSF